jgi:ribosome modulation factor
MNYSAEELQWPVWARDWKEELDPNGEWTESTSYARGYAAGWWGHSAQIGPRAKFEAYIMGWHDGLGDRASFYR